MFEQDYIMRLIHQIVMFLIHLVFRRKEEDEEGHQEDQQENLLISGAAAEKYDRLTALVRLGRINEAENRLYEELDAGNMEDLKMALLFYDAVNELSGEELEKADYTRAEIREGIERVLEEYGYKGLAEALEGGTGDAQDGDCSEDGC